MTKAVLKEITKLHKVPHPKSRKTAQLTRKAIRSAARDNIKNVNFIKQNLVGEKFMWFKERIETPCVTPAQVLELVESYLGRFDEELEQIKLKHSVGQRKGRQHASREDIIKMTKKREANEFNTCGLEMPALLNEKQLTMLLKWDGELRFMSNFKVVRYNRKYLENEMKKSRVGKKRERTVTGNAQDAEAAECTANEVNETREETSKDETGDGVRMETE